MILKIQTGKNNPILRKKSLEIKEVNGGIRKLIKNMMETMTKNNGIGLSACQIGKNIRMFVVPKELSPAYLASIRRSGRQGRKKHIFINPKIIKLSKKTEVMEEGCLSLPGIFLKIKRAKSIKIKALDEEGKEFKLKVRGLLARVIQHENDHLNGILISDHEKD